MTDTIFFPTKKGKIESISETRFNRNGYSTYMKELKFEGARCDTIVDNWNWEKDHFSHSRIVNGWKFEKYFDTIYFPTNNSLFVLDPMSNRTSTIEWSANWDTIKYQSLPMRYNGKEPNDSHVVNFFNNEGILIEVVSDPKQIEVTNTPQTTIIEYSMPGEKVWKRVVLFWDEKGMPKESLIYIRFKKKLCLHMRQTFGFNYYDE